MTRHRRRRLKLKSLYVWHRWLGTAAALWVLVLSATGIALNHTEELALDSRPVHWAWLQDAYGIRIPEAVPAFRVGNRWLSQWGDQLYLDTRPVARLAEPLAGAAAVDGIIVAASARKVLLFTPAGELVEALGPAQGVPRGIRALGLDGEGHVVVEAGDGLHRADAQFTSWHGTDKPPLRWAGSEPLPPHLARAVAPRYRAALLSAERVLLDLHSGRLLGRAGVWLSDAVAVILILLAASGTFLWYRQIRRRRSGGRRRK